MDRPLKGECGSVKINTEKNGTRHIYIGGERQLTVNQRVAEELVAALTASIRPYAGYSIFDRIQQNLDPIIDRMMAGNPAEDDRDPGRAEAFSMCLALIRNAYQPDYPGEKERQMERYWERAGEDDE